MRIEQNTVSRDWTVLYKGRRFYVNFTESDGQTLALCNRDNWQVHEETENGVEELNPYAFNGCSPQQWQRARENEKIMEKLVGYCIRNWDNWFMRAVKKGWKENGQF
jgi:hypothetical protein